MSFIFTSIKKEISILSHIERVAGNFCKSACPKKDLALTFFFNHFFSLILKTILLLNQPNIHILFYTSLVATSSFLNIDGPVTILLYIWLRMLISFLNDVEIQLILEFKYIFGKYYSWMVFVWNMLYILFCLLVLIL